MKQPLKPVACVVMTALITVLSCHDSDDNMFQGTSRTELLTGSPWVRTSLVSTPAYDWYGDGVSDTDVLSILHPCEKDNLDIYRPDGVFVTDEGPTKCDPGDPQQWTLRWTFADNETRLVFDGAGIHDEYTLMELTEATLTFRITFVENGVTYTHVESYGH